jgi:hypothetical protein
MQLIISGLKESININKEEKGKEDIYYLQKYSQF